MARTPASEDIEAAEEADDSVMASYGLNEDEDDDVDSDSPEGDSPEDRDTDSPATGDIDDDDDDAPAASDASLPGDEDDEPETPEQRPAEGPSASADRPAPDASPDAPEVKPWSFKADGKEVTVPRSQIFRAKNPDGSEEEYVLFPAAEIQRTLHNHLADRGTWRNEKKQLLEKVAELDPQNHEEVIKARELTSFIFGLMDKSEDEILEAIAKMREGRPTWEADQRAKSLEAKLAARDQVKIDPDPELERIREEETESQLQTGLRSQLTEYLKKPEFAGLDANEVFEDLWELRNKLFFTAGEDLPQFGLKKGQIGIDLGYLEERLGRETKRVNSIRERAGQAREVARRNSEQLEGAAGPKKKRALVPAGRTGKPKEDEDEYESWKQDLLNGDDED